MMLHWAASDCHAQLIIAKDPRQCTYGLKDSSGEWIVQPIYALITQGSWWNYSTLSGTKQGIINRYGQVIVPAIYDEVVVCSNEIILSDPTYIDRRRGESQWRYNQYYKVQDKGLYGLIGPNAKVIIPPSLRYISSFMEGTAIGTTTDGKSVLIDTTGITGYAPSGCWIDPNNYACVGKDRFIISRQDSSRTKYPVTLQGVCDGRGRIILPPQYGIATDLARLNCILADTAFSGNYRVYSMDGVRISRDEFRIEQTPEFRTHALNDFVYVSQKDQQGVLGHKGKLIVPCQFDSIKARWKHYDETIFLCYDDSATMLYNEQGRQFIRDKYDHLEFNKDWYSRYERGELTEWEHPNTLLLATNNGKWGALADNGDILIPVIYDTIFPDQQYFIMFYSPTDVRALYPVRSNVFVPAYYMTHDEIINAKTSVTTSFEPFLPGGDTIGFVAGSIVWDETSKRFDTTDFRRYAGSSYGYAEVEVNTIWTDDSLHLIWELPVRVEDIPACKQDHYSHDAASCFSARIDSGEIHFESVWKFRHPLSHQLMFAGDTAGTFYSDSGRTIIKFRGARSAYIHNRYADSLFLMRVGFSSGKVALSDFDGNLILDSTFYDYELFNNDSIWVATQRSSGECKPIWNLYSRSANRLLIDPRNQLIEPASLYYPESALISETGYGVYSSSKLKFIIRPKYRLICPLDESANHFVVTGFNGKSYLIDSTETKFVNDTVMRVSCINGSKEWTIYNDNDGVLLYTVKTPNTVYVCSNTGIQSYSSLKKDSLADRMVVRRSGAYHETYRYDHRTYLFVDSVLELATWQKNLLCDSIVTGRFSYDIRQDLFNNHFLAPGFSLQSDHKCESWPKVNPYLWQVTSNELSPPDFNVIWCNKNILSYQVVAENTSPYIPQRERNYTVYLYNDDSTSLLGLSDLFIGNGWTEIVTNALLARLDSQPQIISKCTDITLYPAMLEYRFLIGADSLLLYPDWGMDRYLRNPEICVAIPWSDLTPFLKPEIKKAIGLD